MTSLTTLPRNTNISLPGKKRLRQDPLTCVRDKIPVSTWREEQSPQVHIEKWKSSCVHVEGRAGPQHAQTRQNLHIHRGPVYTRGKEHGPLHKRRGGRVSLYTHRRGRVLVPTKGEGGEKKGMVLLCTHREGLWILTGIPGSPEGPASPSSPALPCRSEESENAMSPPSTPGTLPAAPPFSGESSHSLVLLSRLWTQLGQGAPADRDQGQGQGLKSR